MMGDEAIGISGWTLPKLFLKAFLKAFAESIETEAQSRLDFVKGTVHILRKNVQMFSFLEKLGVKAEKVSRSDSYEFTVDLTSASFSD
jgi:hypothetical protein